MIDWSRLVQPFGTPPNGGGSRRSMLVISDRSHWGPIVCRFAESCGFECAHLVWQHGDPPQPRGLDGWAGDWIVGFKADYILTGAELAAAGKGALNFHPGPPSLRGVGGYEHAIASGWTTYGVTCHHMTVRVDAGPIITSASFGIPAGSGVDALREIAAAHLYIIFVQIVTALARGERLPTSGEQWSGPLHTWAELDERSTDVVDRPAT